MHEQFRPHQEWIEPAAIAQDPSKPSHGLSWTTIVIVPILLVGLAAFILPTFSCGCRPAYRVQCGANEHQLIGFVFDYAREHRGNMPPTLSALSTSNTDPINKLMHCPQGPGDYIYLGNGIALSAVPKDFIVLYEPPTNHTDSKTGKGSMNVGYANGSVVSIAQLQADKIIAELNAGHNPPRPEMVK